MLNLPTLTEARALGICYPGAAAGVSDSMMKIFPSLVVAALGATLLACGSMSERVPQDIAVSGVQNGQSVQMQAGDVVTVSLDTTFWTFAPTSDASILQSQSDQVISPAAIGTCPPGMGCGTTMASYKALKTGTATVSAGRISCGEARRCVGSEGAFLVTIVVS